MFLYIKSLNIDYNNNIYEVNISNELKYNIKYSNENYEDIFLFVMKKEKYIYF